MLTLDWHVSMSTFDDGSLGAVYTLRGGQLRKVMRYERRTEDDESEWAVKVVPAGDVSLN